MNFAQTATDREIIRRYVGQPARLPETLRRRVERDWHGDRIELYALTDLDTDLGFRIGWLCIGANRVALLEPAGRSRDNSALYSIRHVSRASIRSVRAERANVCNVLRLLGRPGEAPLATVRYTNRQRLPFESIRAALTAAPDEAPPVSDGNAAYARGIAKPIRDAQALVAERNSAVLFRLLGYLRPYRNRLIAGMSAAGAITLLSLTPPYIAASLIDDVVEPVQSGSLDVATGTRIAWLAVAAIALVHLCRQACSWIRVRVMFVLGELVAHDLRRELYAHLQTLSLGFFARKKTGSLITRVSADTDRLWEFLAVGFVDASLAVLVLIGLGVILISLDWRLGLIMTVPVPLVCWAIFWHGERLNRLFLGAWRKWSNLTDVLSDTIPGMRVVKAFNQEHRERARFDDRNGAALRQFNRIHHQWTTFWPVLLLAIHLLSVAVWALAIPRLLGTGGPELSAGTFVAFLLYMTMFIAPIEIVGQLARIGNRATSSAHRVFEVLDTQPDVVDRRDPVRLDGITGHVRFDDVAFSYDGGRAIIRGVDFEIRPGETIGLVGPSGGGKSTLINLLARFYDVTGGRITIEGVDLRLLDSGWYRRQIGMVLQDPYLFFGTIAENIRYGMPDASDAAVVDAAVAANAHDFICRLDAGYETLVGERGQTLSGGERQRISIARAILRDPRLLVLDEATSSVDTDTERKIQDALDRLSKGRTVVAIAHRLSTLERADRILVVEQGRISEQGTHAELLSRDDGTYRRLHALQRNLAHGA